VRDEAVIQGGLPHQFAASPEPQEGSFQFGGLRPGRSAGPGIGGIRPPPPEQLPAPEGFPVIWRDAVDRFPAPLRTAPLFGAGSREFGKPSWSPDGQADRGIIGPTRASAGTGNAVAAGVAEPH
jgi:hypothetical protein